MDRVAELLDGWRQLAAWRHDWTASPGPRMWNTLVDRLNRVAEEAVADPVSVAAIREIASNNPDAEVRRNARQWIHPWVPRPPSREDLDRWLRHPLIALGEVPAAHAIMLVPGAESLTWIGGGEVLVQLETPEHPADSDAWAALPRGGALQFLRDGTIRHVAEPQPGESDWDPVDVWVFPEDCPMANERMLETVHSQWGLIEDYSPAGPLPLLHGTGSRRVWHLPGRAPIEYDLTPAGLRPS
ncbi:hypothetical protein [Actinoplanes sp. NPDC026670]|uniref:hypothetical protein n=1 Tax=Actinoplanes sp. NPDC026670 TaxID=3154700 RepID=UPI0033CC5742